MKRSIVNLMKIATLTVILGISGTVYCKAAVSAPLPATPSTNVTGSKDVAKTENGDKNNENTVFAKKVEDLKKELSNIKGRNDEMNERVSKSNTQIIDTLKKIKSKKGISKKKLRIFNRNEEAIAGKLESLTKLIDGLRENADKISFSEKKLNEISKNEGVVKVTDNKAADNKATDGKASDNKASDNKTSDNKVADNKASDSKAVDNKASDNKVVDNKTNEIKVTENKAVAESTDNSYYVSVQLESLIWLHLDRNRLFLQIFDVLAEISALLP